MSRYLTCTTFYVTIDTKFIIGKEKRKEVETMRQLFFFFVVLPLFAAAPVGAETLHYGERMPLRELIGPMEKNDSMGTNHVFGGPDPQGSGCSQMAYCPTEWLEFQIKVKPGSAIKGLSKGKPLETIEAVRGRLTIHF